MTGGPCRVGTVVPGSGVAPRLVASGCAANFDGWLAALPVCAYGPAWWSLLVAVEPEPVDPPHAAAAASTAMNTNNFLICHPASWARDLMDTTRAAACRNN